MKKDPILENALHRDIERLIQNRTMPSEASSLILKFSSDIGAIRNCGRRGSNFAPNALLSVVKKLAKHTANSWAEIDIADPELEELSFKHAQEEYSKKLKTILISYSKVQHFIYLGGGHDHILPALMALNFKFKKIIVINVDAHLDTRTDNFYHSGTPFRQFAESFEGEFQLIQLGIHDFANTKTTMSDLGKAKEVVATYEDLVRITNHFTQNRKALERMIPFDRDALYFFSLDADAIDAGIMEGVSAVNHKGLPLQFVDELLTYCLDVLKTKHFGIYEYNPVFDNLSQKGARALSSLIYKVLDR